jgi:hypothetical protein
MKKLLTLFTVSLLVLAGCQNMDSPVEPAVNSNSRSFLPMPEMEYNTLEKTTVFTGEINGSQGGEIEFQYSYKAERGRRVKVSGSLVIPAGAFNYTTDISVVVNTKNAYLDFYPSPVTYSKPLLLTVTYENMNLQNVDLSKVDFYYYNESNGSFEALEKDGKEVDADSGTLKVINVQLNHFSRFGWVI